MRLIEEQATYLIQSSFGKKPSGSYELYKARLATQQTATLVDGNLSLRGWRSLQGRAYALRRTDKLIILTYIILSNAA
jgi:hypothetical protein